MRLGTVVTVVGVASWAFGLTVRADVAVVIEHQYTVGNNNFSAFAYNPLIGPHEFMTTGYGFGKDLRWSEVLDDSVEPWTMNGAVMMDSAQIEFFARDGFASYSLTYNAWGMNFDPLDEKYFIGCISILRDPANNNARVDAERDLIMLDPRLPNGGTINPSGVSVSNTGGIYTLTDSALGPGTGFVSSGVQVGDQLTLYPLHYTAEIYSTTYTVTQIVSETELRLDQDPLWSGSPTQVDVVSYILMMQPWITLETFRLNIPYYAADLDAGPKAHNKGGLSPDGLTLYIGDIISENLLAVDTQQRETFSVLVSDTTLLSYVIDQMNAGRHHPIVNPDRAYIDGTSGAAGGWDEFFTAATVVFGITVPTPAVGKRCLSVTFNGAGAQLGFHANYGLDDLPRNTADYTHLRFWIHGGASGGQQMTVSLFDDTGAPGSVVAVPPPVAGTWTLVEIPIGTFGLSTIGDIIFDDTTGAAQPEFFLDDIGFPWTDPLPPGVGDYSTDGAGMASCQIECDEQGRVWFSEGETDDLLWTTDGLTLNAFLIADEIVSEYVASGALDTSGYSFSNGVQILGLITDPMGTIYWGENQTRSIWKAPAKGAADHIINVGTKEEIQLALGIGSSPRGLNCFSIRDLELLTFNFVDSNTVYKVDLDTFDYGDFDGDFDVDLDDYNLFFHDCLAGPGVLTPPAACTPEQFEMADMDRDLDVDLFDFREFQFFFQPAGSRSGGDGDG